MVDIPGVLPHLGESYSTEDAIYAAANEPGHNKGWTCAEFSALVLGLDHDARGWTPQLLVETLFNGYNP